MDRECSRSVFFDLLQKGLKGLFWTKKSKILLGVFPDTAMCFGLSVSSRYSRHFSHADMHQNWSFKQGYL